jgi:hypothetical protein
MDFVFSGFRQAGTFREYTFEGIAEDRSRSRFLVNADLNLARRHGITLQELPLLCLHLLEGLDTLSPAEPIEFTEEAMKTLAAERAAIAKAAALKKRPWRPRKPDTAVEPAVRTVQNRPLSL